MNKESAQRQTANDQEIVKSESGRQHSKRSSFIRSLSHGSSGIGSSRHSFSVSFGIPSGMKEFESDIPAETISPDADSPKPKVSLLRLAYLNKPEIPFLLIGATLSIINGIVLPVFALLLASAINAFYEPAEKLRRDTSFWALMFVCLGTLSFLTLSTRSYFFNVAGWKLVNRIRSKCFEKVTKMEISWFDEAENSSGAIGARLSADAASVRRLVGDALALVVQNIATAVAGLAVAFAANWQLALIILALFPLLGVNGYVQTKFMRGFSADAKASC